MSNIVKPLSTFLLAGPPAPSAVSPAPPRWGQAQHPGRVIPRGVSGETEGEIFSPTLWVSLPLRLKGVGSQLCLLTWCWPVRGCCSQEGLSLLRGHRCCCIWLFPGAVAHRGLGASQCCQGSPAGCPPTQLVPEMVLGSFRELGSSSVLKANEA